MPLWLVGNWDSLTGTLWPPTLPSSAKALIPLFWMTFAVLELKEDLSIAHTLQLTTAFTWKMLELDAKLVSQFLKIDVIMIVFVVIILVHCFCSFILFNCCSVVACTNGDVRIVDGDRPGRGRLELCMNGQWGTICRTGFNRPDASVACRQLGFSRFREFIASLFS